MTSPRRSPHRGAVLLAVAALTLTACNDDGATDADAEEEPTIEQPAVDEIETDE